MRNIWTIARREYKQYFSSPVAYAVAFLFLLVLGWFFFQNVQQAILMASIQPLTPGVQMVIGPMVSLFLFTMPAVTMRLVAEENRMGTLELLLTAPIRDWELVIGKWLGGLLFMLTLIAVTIIYSIVLNGMTEPGIDQGPLISGYLGLILMVGALIAIGVAVSSFFSNQMAAFFTSLVIVLMIWLIRSSSATESGPGATVMNYLNFVDHFLGFFRGVIDLTDVVYFLSVTVLALFIGSVAIEMRRWR